MSSAIDYRSGGASAPAAVPVLHNLEGGTSWRDVHSTIADSVSITGAGDGVEALRMALGGDEIALSKLVRSRGEEWMGVIDFSGSGAIEWWPLADHPVVRQVIETGVPRQIADTDPTAHRTELDVLGAGGYRSLLMLPVELEGMELGLLEVYSSQMRRWSVSEIAHARAACNQLAALLVQPTARRAETTAGVLGRLG
jgi:GAF domain-containing protein